MVRAMIGDNGQNRNSGPDDPLPGEAGDRAFPDRVEERDLLRRALSGDSAAVTGLVTNHRRFVVGMARRYRGYGLPMADLVQEGMVGLMQALRRFDPGRDVRFATYARWWIRAAIQEYVARSWSLVRPGTSSAHRTLFFALRKRMAEMREGADSLGEDVLAPLAERFGLSLREAFQVALGAVERDRSLDRPVDGENGGETWTDRLADPAPDPEQRTVEAGEASWRRGLLAGAIDRLPPREQLIIRERFLSEAARTREAIGQQLGISRERVRQLEKQALETLRRLLHPVTT